MSGEGGQSSSQGAEAEEPGSLAAKGAESSGINLVAKWNRKSFSLSFPAEATVGQVREKLQELTEVLPKRQKLIGLGKKPNPEDEMTLENLKLKANHSFMMVGTPEEKILVEASQLSDLPDVINDLDWDYDPSEQDEARSNAENRLKLEEKIRTVSIRTISEPRPGKKLLVLDLDYTLLDFKGTESRMENLKRPFCDAFLTACYAHYDIVIWSQTSWRWLEVKLTEMGILQNPKFSITFVLDRTSMFSVKSKMSDGKFRQHEVKPLELIWTKFPNIYTASNTVHVDDLSRNFAMNPQQGLKISPFKESVRVRGQDKQLKYLSYYLVHIALNVEDFKSLKHSRWADYLQQNNLIDD